MIREQVTNVPRRRPSLGRLVRTAQFSGVLIRRSARLKQWIARPFGVVDAHEGRFLVYRSRSNLSHNGKVALVPLKSFHITSYRSISEVDISWADSKPASTNSFSGRCRTDPLEFWSFIQRSGVLGEVHEPNPRAVFSICFELHIVWRPIVEQGVISRWFEALRSKLCSSPIPPTLEEERALVFSLTLGGGHLLRSKLKTWSDGSPSTCNVCLNSLVPLNSNQPQTSITDGDDGYEELVTSSWEETRSFSYQDFERYPANKNSSHGERQRSLDQVLASLTETINDDVDNGDDDQGSLLCAHIEESSRRVSEVSETYRTVLSCASDSQKPDGDDNEDEDDASWQSPAEEDYEDASSNDFSPNSAKSQSRTREYNGVRPSGALNLEIPLLSDTEEGKV